MESLKNKMIKEAENLRITRKFLFIPLNSPDYESSADKFKEVALMCKEKDEKLKYLEEAARTYLMNPVEYNRYNAYLIYQDMADIYGEGEDSINLYIKSGDMALTCNKESLAAKAFERACDICEDTGRKINLMERIVECYNNPSWRHHKTNSVKQLSFLLFQNGEYEKAANTFLLLKSSVYNLCAGMCFYLIGVESDLEVTGEHKEVYDSLFKESEMKRAIEHFLDNNALEKEVKKIMEVCLEKMNPENDIL